MDYRSLILLLTVILQLAIGGFVIRRSPRSPVHRAVLLESSLFALWSFFGVCIWSPALHADTAFFGRLAHAAALFVSTGFVTLGLIFPDGQTRTPRPLRVAIWLVGAVIAAQVVFTPSMIASAQLVDGALTATYGPLCHAYFAYLFLCFGWGLGDLTARYRRSQGMRRLQIQYLLAGLAGSVLLNIPSDVIGPILGFHSAGWMGPAFTLCFVGMVAHAIVRYRLMGIRLFVGRGVASGLALAAAAALFWALTTVTNNAVGHLSVSMVSASAFLVALLFQPLLSRLHTAVARYFYRPSYDYQSIIRSTSRALTIGLDLDRALTHLLTAVQQALEVEHCLVLIRDRSSQAFGVRAQQSRWRTPEEHAVPETGLSPTSPLAEYLQTAGEPMVREEMERALAPERAEAISADMGLFEAAVAVPLLSGNALLAILLVGPKLSGDVFTTQDVDLLSTLGSEAAAAIAYAQLHQEAMQAEKLATLGGLAAGIAHEVKNPLVAVRTFAELLPEKYGDPEFREGFSRVVLGEVERLDGMISQLLDYARPAPPKLEPVEMNAVVEQTLQLVGYQIAKHSVRPTRLFAPNLPPVMADASQLRQVVLNVLLNAVQVMPPGEVLRLTTRRVGGPGERGGSLSTPEAVELEIANGGPAIPREHLERVFEPFFSARSGGTGLGLSICKRIIAEHRGRIWASITDEGLTAFIIQLGTAAPLQGPTEEDVAAREPALAR